MSVYVDPLFRYGGSKTFRWDRSCHMYADTLDELHVMARSIGLKREWFQDHSDLPHYDLVSTKREKAVELGAVEHTREDMVQFKRRRLASEQMGSLFGGSVEL